MSKRNSEVTSPQGYSRLCRTEESRRRVTRYWDRSKHLWRHILGIHVVKAAEHIPMHQEEDSDDLSDIEEYLNSKRKYVNPNSSSVSVDADTTNSEQSLVLESHEATREIIEKETAWERLLNIYRKPADQELEQSDEMGDIMWYTYLPAMTAGLMGIYYGYRNASTTFKRKNQIVKFETHYIAKRKYFTGYVIGAQKLSGAWFIRALLFFGLWSNTMILMEVYRNKTAVLNYTVAGVVAGGISRSHLGLRGFVGGGTICGLLYTIVGVFVSAICYMKPEMSYPVRHYNCMYKQVYQNKRLMRSLDDSLQQTNEVLDDNTSPHDT